MADSNALEFMLKFVVDKGSQAQAEAAIAALEKEGIKFNEKAGRYTLAGQFISKADVQKIYQQEILPAQQKALQQEQAQQQAMTQRLAEARAYSAEYEKQNQLLLEQERIEQQQREIEKERVAQQQAIAKEQKRAINEQRQQSRAFGRAGIGLLIGGMALGQAGTALTSPVDAYIKYAGMADKTSREWLATQKQIEMSTVKIGQNMAAVLAPVDKVKASLLSVVANSKLLSGAGAVIGGAAKGIGGVAQTAGQFAFAYTSLQQLNFLKELQTASQAAAGAATAQAIASTEAAAANQAEAVASGEAAAADTAEAAASKGAAASNVIGKVGGGILGFVKSALPPLLAVYAGSQLAKPVARAAGNEAMGLGDIPKIAGQSIALLVGEFTAMKHGADAGREAVVKVSQALGLLGDSANKTSGVMNEQAVQAYAQYRQQEAEAEKQNSAQRAQIVADGAQQRAELEKQGEQKRADIMQQYNQQVQRTAEDRARQDAQSIGDFILGENRSLADYYRQRAKIVEDGSEQIQKIEADHQRRIREMTQDHNDRVADLVDKRDALGLWRENRDFNRERQQADEETNAQIAQTRADLAKRLQEQQQEFAIMAGRRREDFNRRMAEQTAERAIEDARNKADHEADMKRLEQEQKDELAQLDQQQKDKLTQLDKQYQEERKKRARALGQQLIDLDYYLNGETSRRAQYYAYWTGQFEQYAQNISSIMDNALKTNTSGSRASGGYVSNGLWRMHDDEYVLTKDLTSLAERAAGGKLTNAKVARLLLSGAGGSSRPIQVSASFAFSGLYDAATQKQVYATATRALEDGVRKALRP